MRVVDLIVDPSEQRVQRIGAIEGSGLAVAAKPVRPAENIEEARHAVRCHLQTRPVGVVLHLQRRKWLGHLLPIVRHEVVQLVLDDRAAHGSTELQIVELGDVLSKEVRVRGQRLIPVVHEQRAVGRVGPGARCDVDRSGALPPLSHVVHVGHHLELTHCLHRYRERPASEASAPDRILGLDAVHANIRTGHSATGNRRRRRNDAAGAGA